MYSGDDIHSVGGEEENGRDEMNRERIDEGGGKDKARINKEDGNKLRPSKNALSTEMSEQ